MTDPTLFARLKELRFTDYEAKCYLALLEKETLTVTEVSRIAGIPRANAYEALERLLTKGLCVVRAGRIKKYSALDPVFLKEKVSGDLDAKLEIELEDLKKKLDKKRKEIRDKKHSIQGNLSSLIGELTPLYKDSRSNNGPLEYIEILKDPSAIQKRIAPLVFSTKKELLIFSRPPYLLRRLTEKEIEQGGFEFSSKDVKVRSICEAPAKKEEREYFLEYVKFLRERGDEFRISQKLPLKMMIIDERIVLFALEDPVLRKISSTSLLIEHRTLAETLKIVFETLWEQAEEYQASEWHPGVR